MAASTAPKLGLRTLLVDRKAEATIGDVVRGARACGHPVVVVDDGSRDGSSEAAERAAGGRGNLRVTRLKQFGAPPESRPSRPAASRAPFRGQAQSGQPAT